MHLNKKIKFEGFEPNSNLQKLAKDIIKYVEDRSPNQACHQAIISKTTDGFLGELKVSSLSGVFIVESQAESPSHVLNELYAKIRKELNHWLKNRDLITYE